MPPTSDCPVDPVPETPENEAACNLVQAVAGEDTDVDLPGTSVLLDGGASSSDRCVDGQLEYRWRIANDILQEYSNNSMLMVSPPDTVHYLLDVRCSSDPTCQDTDGVLVAVDWPGEVSARPETLGEAGPSPVGIVLDWEDLGSPIETLVLGLDLDGLRLAPSTDNVQRLQNSLCTLGPAAPASPGRVQLIENSIELAPGEALGYLAQALQPRTSLPTRPGSLGQGDAFGPAGNVPRGSPDPTSLPTCELE